MSPCFCVGVCLCLVFRPNLAQDGAQGIFTCVCSCELISPLCAFQCMYPQCGICCCCCVSQYFSLVSDVYTRSNRESIWWARRRVFEESQGASGYTLSASVSLSHTNTQTQINRHTFTNAFININISLSYGISLSPCLPVSLSLAHTKHSPYKCTNTPLQ